MYVFFQKILRKKHANLNFRKIFVHISEHNPLYFLELNFFEQKRNIYKIYVFTYKYRNYLHILQIISETFKNTFIGLTTLKHVKQCVQNILKFLRSQRIWKHTHKV